MDAVQTAELLVAAAVDHEQAVMRCDSRTPVREIREQVRRIARQRGVRVRTGMVSDVLVVILADARVWNETAPVMRSKLAAPPEPNRIASVASACVSAEPTQARATSPE